MPIQTTARLAAAEPDLLSYDRIVVAFGSPDQWASMRYLAPGWFDHIAGHETGFGRTIQRSCNIRTLADRGRLYQALIQQPEVARLALQHAWNEPVRIRLEYWVLPAGAFGEGIGPS